MRRALFLAAAVLAARGACFAADPYVGYIYPSGIQAGSTNRFLVGGQNLRNLRGIHFGGMAVRVLEIKGVPGFPNPPGAQRRYLTKWLDGIAAGVREEPPRPTDSRMDEWRSNAWWRVLGSLRPLEISLVEQNLFRPRNNLQGAPSLRQQVIVTLAADAAAKPGSAGVSVYGAGGISAPRPFAVSAFPRVAEPLYVPPHRARPPLAQADVTRMGVVLDGQIMPGETDAFRVRFAQGRRYTVKVTARELQPYIGDAVPGFFNPTVTVKNAAGKTVATADDTARFRPDPSFVFVPASEGVHTVEIRDVLYRGRADFVYSIEIAPIQLPRRPPAGKVNVKKPAARTRLPAGVCRFSGVVSKPGEKRACEFVVDRPGRRLLDVVARRAGSSLDAVLTLRKAGQTRALAQWDDATNKVFVGTIPQRECDPVGEYEFKEPGRYVAEIADRTGHGGNRYFWRLDIRPPQPGFAVYSARSTLPLDGRRPLKMDFVVVRKEGFTGPVTLEFPKDIRADNVVATAGVERVSARLTYAGGKVKGPTDVKIFAWATVNGRRVRGAVVPCDEYEQAFAWRHLVPAKSFVMQAVSPRPARKKASKTPAPTPPGR